MREVEAGKSRAHAAREHQVHANLIAKWRKQLQERDDKSFAGSGHVSTDEARIAELERRIGQLTVENAFPI